MTEINTATQALQERPPFEVIELHDGRFPSFYIDHAGTARQFRAWLDTQKRCKSLGMAPKPALIADTPKSGKTALLSRVAPLAIRDAYTGMSPVPLVCPVDFVASIPLGRDMGLDRFPEFANKLSANIREWAAENNLTLPHDDATQLPELRLMDLFKGLNNTGRIIFFLWDEVQIWFQLRSSVSAKVFDTLTFHQHYQHLNFCVTGSSMVTIFRNILSFESNGNYWISAAVIIGSADYATAEEIEVCAAWTAQELSTRYPDDCPTNLLQYCLDSSPAMLCYFFEQHMGMKDTPNLMRRTNKKVADFRGDLVPILAEIQSTDPQLFQALMKLAFGVAKPPAIPQSETSPDFLAEYLDELLGSWSPVFAPLICFAEDGYMRIRGYYGTLFARAFTPSGSLKISEEAGGLENLSKIERASPENASRELFADRGLVVQRWLEKPSYLYFANANNQANPKLTDNTVKEHVCTFVCKALRLSQVE